MTETPDTIVVGTGPSGLMAAETISAQGYRVALVDRMPSPGRKLLMAGKSGLNLTFDTDTDGAIAAVHPTSPQIRAALSGFGPAEAKDWAQGLGQDLFTGTSGRVFPTVMKASPLLRAWLARLRAQGVTLQTAWRWNGWRDGSVVFETPQGAVLLNPPALVLALGGASWSRLGTDGSWAEHLPAKSFQPANMGFEVAWSEHMQRQFGQPVKQVRLSTGETQVLGEFVISRTGIEGSAVYALSRHLREVMTGDGADLIVDLLPDLSVDALTERLSKPRGKASHSNHLRKRAGLAGAKSALLREVLGTEIPAPQALAERIKHLPLRVLATRPLDEAISTSGGLPLDKLDDHLMLHDHPGVFVAGEMLDWEAPTGGFLITTCLATGRLAGQGALNWLGRQR